MSTRVALVFPKFNFTKKKNFALPPLGILYLASYLKQKRPDISILVLDLETKNWDLHTCVTHILEFQPDLVGFSVMTPFLNNTMLLVQEIKKRNNAIKVVLGGPHITATQEEIYSLNYSHMPDFLVFGEGEKTLVNIVDNLNNGSTAEIKGAIHCKGDGSVIGVAKPGEPIADLDSLPIIDFGMLNVSEYSQIQSKTINSLSLMASRGCPFNCTFCDVHITQGRKLRLRSPEHIIEEIRLNRDRYKITDYYFKDSTFTVNRNWVIRLCNLLFQQRIHISWTCNTRVELVDNELLALMSKAGCKVISFGFESVDDDVLKQMNKSISASVFPKAVKMCKQNGIEVSGFFMVGNFGENLERAQQTLQFALNEDISWASFSPVTAYPGTDLYQHAVETGILKDPMWYLKKSEDAFVSLVFGAGGLNHPDFSIHTQIQFVKTAHRKFYCRPGWILKMLRHLLNSHNIIKVFSFAPEFLKFVIR